jgi:hypothetical protein
MASTRLRSVIPPPITSPTISVNDPQSAAPVSIALSSIERLDPARNTDSNTGHVTQIHIVPDFRFPLIEWIYNISRHVPDSAYKANPYASPASILGYTIIMLVAMAFHSDSTHAFETSKAARDIMNDSMYSRFFQLLLDLPVPDLAHNTFSSLQPFLPDDIPALAFIYTLGPSSYLRLRQTLWCKCLFSDSQSARFPPREHEHLSPSTPLLQHHSNPRLPRRSR